MVYPTDSALAWFNLPWLTLQFYLANLSLVGIGANMSYRKSAYVGHPDRNYAEDSIFLRRMVKRWGADKHHHDQSLVVINEHSPIDWIRRDPSFVTDYVRSL